MKKHFAAFAVALAAMAFASQASAQQYVYPAGSPSDYGVQPYAQNLAAGGSINTAPAAEQPMAQAPTYAPTATYASEDPVVLTQPPAPASNPRTGYGTAIYGGPDTTNYAIPHAAHVDGPIFAVAAAPAPTATGYAAPPALPADVYQTGTYVPTYAHNWTGAYVGIYGGGAFGGNMHAQQLRSTGGVFPPGTAYNDTGTNNDYSLGDAFTVGGTVGYNYEIPFTYGPVTGIVIGMESEGGVQSLVSDHLDPNSSPGVANDTVDKTRLGDWDAIVAGRAGLAFDRLFLYGKFGAVFSELKSTVNDTCTSAPCGTGAIHAGGHQDIADGAFGGGVEYALTNSWSLKGEYMYLNTNDSYLTCGSGLATASGSTFCAKHELDGTHTVKLGLDYHFNDLFEPRSPTAPRW
jgi:outer membrane immunogenic protein